MALKTIFHVVANEFNVDATTGTIAAGMIVNFDANGNIIPADAVGHMPVGVAGDTKRQATGLNNVSSAAVVIGANGAQTANTQNRVSDSYNETLASGMITVYTGGGEFWTDQYSTVTTAGAALNWEIGAALCADIGAGTTTAGQITNSPAGGKVWYVGTLTGVPQALPSGVPGTDIQGSISFGTYIRFILNIVTI